jgi:imidazolonepropionase-like amidohydrolase
VKHAIVAVLLLVACGSSEPAKPSPAAARDAIAITGGLVKPMNGPDIPGGTVLIKGGLIVEVGKEVEIPAGATVVDAKGKIVMPGFIDSNTRVGILEVEQVPQTRDDEEGSDVVTPQVWVGDAFMPASEVIPVTRMNGVTSVVVAPGENNVMGGVSMLVALDGRLTEEMTVKARVGLHVSFGEPPKEKWGDKNVVQTRMGIVAKIREVLTKAQELSRKLEEYEKKKDDPKAEKPGYDAKMLALVPVVRGELPVIARAHKVDDIRTALRIADEFKLKLILSHATEGWKIAEELAKRKVAVLVGPVNTQPDSIETTGATYENADILFRAGVKIAIQTGDAHNVRNLPFMAGLACAYGLPEEEALRAITVNAAEIFGVADRVGVLAKGARGDVVVFEGSPIQPRSTVVRVYIGGREIELTSRQKGLMERWKK